MREKKEKRQQLLKCSFANISFRSNILNCENIKTKTQEEKKKESKMTYFSYLFFSYIKPLHKCKGSSVKEAFDRTTGYWLVRSMFMTVLPMHNLLTN